MRADTEQAAEMIDAALFSGDEFIGDMKARAELLGYIERWRRRLKELGSECARCGSDLDEKGLCIDVTCPFTVVPQDDPKGWVGHPAHT